VSDNPWLVIAATVVIVALSAFFVAVEFAALAAKRHRLEEAAPTSRSARAALRNSSELTLLLAGSQLGITAATLALGAISKPAVHHWLTPLFETWGLPLVAADRAGPGDLVESLRTWLAAHGQWEPAAARLGVHRHTLRKRIGRAGELLGRDLDSPGVRAELWLALHPPRELAD